MKNKLIASGLILFCLSGYIAVSGEIATVVRKGAYVYAYDKDGHQITTLSAGSGPQDGLVGYTSTTISVRKGAYIYTYDEKGRQLSAISAK